jgi:UDP-N-acetylglucosamine--N-acetylmuramyl-(pentapeptide) pyrophosphoryl-undecaprenol N-acetylglucosamine transferase
VNLVIAGGGTGGHVYPAVALAGEFRRLLPDTKVTFIGAERGLETKVIPPLGYELIALPVQGVVGGASLTGIWRGMALLKESLKMTMILRRLKPDLVIGVGGYASVPAVLAAALRGIPRSIIEQNVMPGRANRVLARMVQRIYQGFASRTELFPTEKTMVTGNPIRPEVLPPKDLERPNGRRSLLILGGSQGAKQINELALDFVPRLMERFPDLTVLHQAGPDHGAAVRERYEKAGVEVEVVDFITGMADAYSGADLCVSRAGAMAISELAAAGLPAILIPYPHAAGGHQDLNALWLEERGGAVTVHPSDATPELLLEAISCIFDNPDQLVEMANSCRRTGVRDAAERIARAELERIGYSGRGDAGTRRNGDKE